MKTLRVPFPASAARRGFSLVELLTVLVIISILSALAFAAFTSLGKSDSFNNATSTISTLLEQARAYAMANNTYVFVGIEETNGSQPASGPQSAGIGRVAIQAFAALDGTMNLTASNLTAIDRLQVLNNVDLPAALSATSGTLPNRPTADYFLGSNIFPAVSSSSAITSRNFSFTKIIAFDSLGVVHVPAATPPTGFQYIEIDVQPANGSTVLDTSANVSAYPNVSAIEVDATNGVVTVYRS